MIRATCVLFLCMIWSNPLSARVEDWFTFDLAYGFGDNYENGSVGWISPALWTTENGSTGYAVARIGSLDVDNHIVDEDGQLERSSSNTYQFGIGHKYQRSNSFQILADVTAVRFIPDSDISSKMRWGYNLTFGADYYGDASRGEKQLSTVPFVRMNLLRIGGRAEKLAGKPTHPDGPGAELGFRIYW